MCGRMSMSNEGQVLDYASPQKRSWLSFLARRLAMWIVVAAALFCGAIVLPHPSGIWYWYLGEHYPKLMVAIDSAGLTICREGDIPITSGWIPVIVAKLLVYALPVW